MKKIIIFGANIILISVLLIIANPDEELTEKSSVTTRKSTAQKIDSKTQKNYRKNPLGFDAGPGESDEEKEQSRISHPGPGESDEERQMLLVYRPGPGESDEEKEQSRISHPGPGESDEERQQSLALRPGPGESDEEKEKSHILHPGPGESE